MLQHTFVRDVGRGCMYDASMSGICWKYRVSNVIVCQSLLSSWVRFQGKAVASFGNTHGALEKGTCLSLRRYSHVNVSNLPSCRSNTRSTSADPGRLSPSSDSSRCRLRASNARSATFSAFDGQGQVWKDAMGL